MIIDLTVKLLAIQLKISIDYLICQFADLGISKTALDHVSPEEKNILFTHIYAHKKQVGLLNQLTLQRKIRSTLNIFGSGGKSKKVQIEVRKKHTYIPCNSAVLPGINSKQKDTETLVSSFTEDSQLSNDVTKNSVFLQEKVDVNDISITSHDKCILNKESNIMLIPKQLGNNSSVNKQKKIKNVIHHSSKKNMEDVSSGTSYVSDINRDRNLIPRSSTISNKKQTNGNDRRVRVRQRLRPSFNKIRNHKANINLKNRKNNDHVFEIKYDESDDRHFFRGIKSKQRKPSILTHAFKKPVQVINRDVVIGEIVTVSELANKMAVKSSQVIKVLMKLGIMATINQTLDQQIAQLVAEEMGHHVILRRESDLESRIINDRDTAIMSSSGNLLNNLEFRAPVVTVMGHVDHGKTSLLDYIRSSKLVDLEAGGITQRIGAYCVDIPNKGMITFLDTPGHAAFSGMRIRGIQITDIVVLVVAVDDGVMPQTIEAIQHIKSAGVSMIVALNKIDKVNVSNFDKIKTQLSKQGIISEEWGGETQFINISAKLGHGIDDLLDAILLESEILELKAVRNGMATGIVIESFLDKGRGPVAVTLIREGTLKSGDVILCGSEFGRVRAMRNEFGLNINLAGPSIPVEVFGLSGLPYAGDIMTVVRDERKAREVALYRQGKYRTLKLAEKEKSKLKNMFDISLEKNIQVLDFNVVLKADIQGSVEAVVNVLKNLSNVNVKVNIVDSGVGGITETDVSLAIATRSVLLGFNVRPDLLARRIIELERVSFYYYSIIYDLINDVKKLVDCMLAPKCDSKNVAVAEVRDVFRLPKLGNIAGCMILEGVVKRHSKVRVLRKKLVIYEGEVESLRRFKDDVNEVRAGMECGIAIKNWTDISLGDYIEIFEEINNN